MDWIHAHRYTAALIAMAVLVVVGGVTAKNGSSGTPAGRSVVRILYRNIFDISPPCRVFRAPISRHDSSDDNEDCRRKECNGVSVSVNPVHSV